METKMYNVEQVAEMFCVTKDTVRNWITSGKLGAVKLSERCLRIPESDLHAFYESRYKSVGTYFEKMNG